MKVTELDPVIKTKLKARNCAFNLNNGILYIEPGMGANLKKPDEKALKPIKRIVLEFYPKALILAQKDVGGLYLTCDLGS